MTENVFKKYSDRCFFRHAKHKIFWGYCPKITILLNLLYFFNRLATLVMYENDYQRLGNIRTEFYYLCEYCCGSDWLNFTQIALSLPISEHNSDIHLFNSSTTTVSTTSNSISYWTKALRNLETEVKNKISRGWTLMSR